MTNQVKGDIHPPTLSLIFKMRFGKGYAALASYLHARQNIDRGNENPLVLQSILFQIDYDIFSKHQQNIYQKQN